jgi:hypothetical protein
MANAWVDSYLEVGLAPALAGRPGGWGGSARHDGPLIRAPREGLAAAHYALSAPAWPSTPRRGPSAGGRGPVGRGAGGGVHSDRMGSPARQHPAPPWGAAGCKAAAPTLYVARPAGHAGAALG